MTDKYLFISDIHMSDAASYRTTTQPYFWLGDARAALLGTFLQQAVHDASIKQLHIVGDLFDEWIVPYGDAPIGSGGTVQGTLEKIGWIANNPVNAAVMSQLKAMPGARGRDFLHYTPGNHDMVMSSEILSQVIPGASFHPEGFVIDAIDTRVEHGHNYTLFNAPDLVNRLPLGYFVARTVADAVSKGGAVSEEGVTKRIPMILEGMLQSQLTNFPSLFWEQILRIACEPDGARINMNQLADFGESVATADVTGHYQALWTAWGARHPEFPHALLAAISDAGYLALGALSRYAGGARESICVMGHTHYATMHAFNPLDIPLFDSLSKAISAGDSVVQIIDLVLEIVNEHMPLAAAGPLPGQEQADLALPITGTYIYANSGTWITREAPGDQVPPATFVIVEPKSILGKRYANVSVKEYLGGAIDKSKVLYTGTVLL